MLCAYRLRNTEDLDCMREEVSGTVGRKEVLEMYNLATRETFGFLYHNLVSPKLRHMYPNFNQQLQI